MLRLLHESMDMNTCSLYCGGLFTPSRVSQKPKLLHIKRGNYRLKEETTQEEEGELNLKVTDGMFQITLESGMKM